MQETIDEELLRLKATWILSKSSLKARLMIASAKAITAPDAMTAAGGTDLVRPWTHSSRRSCHAIVIVHVKLFFRFRGSSMTLS